MKDSRTLVGFVVPEDVTIKSIEVRYQVNNSNIVDQRTEIKNVEASQRGPAVVLGLLASALLLVAGSALWLLQGSYNPLLAAQCIWFWGYSIENQAGLTLASNFKLLSLNFFNPFAYLFGAGLMFSNSF